MVNAAGPWIDAVLSNSFARKDARNVRLVKGSHIVVPRKFDDPRAYFFQNADGRIFFAIPYQGEFTLIGTTDEDFTGDRTASRISDREIDYLCGAASAYFAEPVRREDVCWTYSGVRPLFDDGAPKAQEATRDYVLKAEGSGRQPRLINVFGGKITTYRRLAEAVMEKVAEALSSAASHGPARPACRAATSRQPATTIRCGHCAGTSAFCPGAWRSDTCGPTARWRAGSSAMHARSRISARISAPGLHAAELRYLVDNEWALTSEDVLWRRTKLGLHIRDSGGDRGDRSLPAALPSAAGTDRRAGERLRPGAAASSRESRGRPCIEGNGLHGRLGGYIFSLTPLSISHQLTG